MFTMQSQRFRHRPDEGIWGDCHRTCIANILAIDPDQVPHEHRYMSGEEFRDQMNEYLSTVGLSAVAMWWPAQISQVLTTHRNLNPSVYFILSGTTPREAVHSVLCIGGVVAKNPSLDDNNDLVAPMPDGNYQTTYILPKRGAFENVDDFERTIRAWRIDSVLVR